MRMLRATIDCIILSSFPAFTYSSSAFESCIMQMASGLRGFLHLESGKEHGMTRDTG